MTWTTLTPNGAIAPIGASLIVLSVLALVYTLGLLYRVIQLRDGRPIPAEGLDEDKEEAEEP